MAANDVVVIGGGGFIGKRLVDMLSGAGHAVAVVSRNASTAPGMTALRGNVADRARMFEIVKGARVVYCLASGGGDAWSDFQRDFIDGAKNVAEACIEHGVKRLIYTSSIAALYLGAPETITERAGTDSKPEARGMYSRAKILAERMLGQMRSGGLPVVIARPGVVVGLGGMLSHAGAGTWPTDLCCLGWGQGTNPLPFVLVDDVARALEAAMDAPGIEGMEFNLAGDVRLTAREWVAALAERSLRNFRYYPQSYFKLEAIEVGKWLIKCAARRKENPFPSFRDLRSRSLVTNLDCTAAKKLLGWRPCADREEFLRQAVDVHLQPVEAGDLRLR
jgi:nucleoside-diphosphate-sugar epimerase